MGFKATDWAYSLDLAPAMKAVLAALAHRADDKTWECFPGQDTIAAMTGTSRATVGRALSGLESLGIISRSRRMRSDGSRTSDLCVLNVSYESECNVAESNIAPSNVAESRDLSVTVQPPMPHSDAARDHSEDQSADQSVLLSEFSEFWGVYPRHESKADALKAYEVARKKTPAAVILTGVRLYALANAGSDKQFVKLAAGWLRGQRWADEPVARAEATGIPDLPSMRSKDGWTQRSENTWPIKQGAGNIITPDVMCDVHPDYPIESAGLLAGKCTQCERTLGLASTVAF